MRCDLHVHSWFSGGAGVPVLDHLGRECYSDPLEVYERARQRGMDLVTLTDHDTVEGAMRLAHLPECFLSEELTVHLEGARQLHVNAFGIAEPQHSAAAGAAARPGGALRRTSPSSGSPRPSTTCSRRSPARASSPTCGCRSAGCR
jgi:predicted metal-dependent phosphoesterase TrpH